MPRLNDGMEKHGTGHFGFSGTRISDLGATEYTLVTIAMDMSSSVSSFVDAEIKALKEIVKACKHSPRADNLMIRLTQFANGLTELHGFKLLSEINVDDYDKIFQVGGMTALFDASENAVSSTACYGKKLLENDFNVNGIVFVLTDGDDNISKLPVSHVKDAFQYALKEETLESLVSVLIGVNVQDPTLSQRLKDFKDKAGFTQYIEVDNASAKTLAKLAEFVSKSISSQSQSLGSGGASQNLPSLSI